MNEWPLTAGGVTLLLNTQHCPERPDTPVVPAVPPPGCPSGYPPAVDLSSTCSVADRRISVTKTLYRIEHRFGDFCFAPGVSVFSYTENFSRVLVSRSFFCSFPVLFDFHSFQLSKK